MGGRSRLVPGLMEVLHLGKDAVYRRLRGSTALTAEELMKLVEVFGVELPVNSGGTNLSHLSTAGDQGDYAPRQYFLRVIRMLRGKLAERDTRLCVITPEMPLDYELALPTLRAFKLFTYGTTTWQVPGWREAVFHPRLIHPELSELAQEFVTTIFQFPGEQLLSASIFDITISQLKYLRDVGRLPDTDLIGQIFDELDFIVNHLEKMAFRGNRYLPGQEDQPGLPEFQIFVNEMSSASSMVILESKETRMLLNVTIKPQFTVSREQKALEHSLSWYAHLLENGTLLGRANTTYTSAFFTKLRRRLTRARNYFRLDSNYNIP